MCVFKHKDKHTSARGGYENNIFFEKMCADLFSLRYNFSQYSNFIYFCVKTNQQIMICQNF